MMEPIQELIRGLYRAFADGDIDGLKAGFAPDVVWHSPGRRSQLAAEYRGIDSVLGFFGRIGDLTAGSFTADLHDVLTGGEYATALHTAHASRGHRTLNDRNVLLFRIADDRAAEVWEHHYDLFSVDEFWS